MKKMIRKTVLATAVLLPLTAHAENIIGLKENGDLIAFDSATPSTVVKTLTPTGLLAGDQLVSIDFRPATSALYLVAQKTPTTSCQLYTISPAGALTAVGAAYACTGSNVKDIDFNPVADAIRVISDNENYRVDPVTGVKTPDTAPAFAAADTNFGDTVSVIGSAYGNNVSGALTTTLYVIDDTNDVLAQVAAPNAGELATIGSLGIAVSFSTAFDISGAAGTAYLFKYNGALANTGQLYTVNLATGAATLAGQVASGNLNLLGMSVAPVSLIGGATAAPVSSSSGGASGVFMLLGLAGLGWWRRRSAR